ncbi:MAG: FAD/NAD(P)-binding protein [Planctomycetota bacterium]
MTKRLAIIGSGSSGLVSLKNAIETLPDWEIVCFERSNSIRGCWGDPHSGFVSTSTKYTTQFACFTKYAANVDPDGRDRRAEFFHDREYGDYLESFADAFGLRERNRLRCRVYTLCRKETHGRWQMTWTDEAS